MNKTVCWVKVFILADLRHTKAQGLQARYLYGYTFANDNGENPVMAKAHAYVDHWPPPPLRCNRGHGQRERPCGGHPLSSAGWWRHGSGTVCPWMPCTRITYDLLIIDDLGAERNTEYALEQMFSIIGLSP